ncbi:HAMP domain-containing histidine kinase [Paenibacillus sp. SYP-B3998]|uniref:histidine kinase n=2 Tax=Paenibacillus sp. SYP-B3998 TaxID=2678564 RepID=A0A6G3ZY73_9BACL|nr:HAMP domain-containing histidine kinase [Paenibacillus sp. SYP-B3998]
MIDNTLKILTGSKGTGLLYLVIVFVFFFFLLTRPIVRYLKTLSDGLMSIASGNLDCRVPITSQDELGVIAQNINYMAEQLQLMMQRERQIEISKMELITNVSHDLRTPLTSMIGYLNLMKNDDYQNLEEHKRYVNNTFNKTQQLKKLIDDLFEYTRLTSGAAQLSFRRVDLSGLLEQIMMEFEPIAHEHALKIEKLWEFKQVYGMVDVEKFVRTIDNLLMNALKFSFKPGEIVIMLAEEKDHIYIAVENQGEPISREQELRLFERFYKAEPSRNDYFNSQGSGLGLSIAQNIIELHGGQMGLEYREGWFKFFIKLPRLGNFQVGEWRGKTAQG